MSITESYAYSAIRCIEVVEQRTRTNENRGSTDLRVEGETRDAPDRVGVPAELAARHWAEAHAYQYEFMPLSGDAPDEGWDFRNPATGLTADIKATEHPDGHLLVPDYQLPVKADRLVLAVVDRVRCVVTFRGWTSSAIFMAHAGSPCLDCGMRPHSGRWLHPSRLRGMDEWAVLSALACTTLDAESVHVV